MAGPGWGRDGHRGNGRFRAAAGLRRGVDAIRVPSSRRAHGRARTRRTTASVRATKLVAPRRDERMRSAPSTSSFSRAVVGGGPSCRVRSRNVAAWRARRRLGAVVRSRVGDKAAKCLRRATLSAVLDVRVFHGPSKTHLAGRSPARGRSVPRSMALRSWTCRESRSANDERTEYARPSPTRCHALGGSPPRARRRGCGRVAAHGWCRWHRSRAAACGAVGDKRDQALLRICRRPARSARGPRQPHLAPRGASREPKHNDVRPIGTEPHGALLVRAPITGETPRARDRERHSGRAQAERWSGRAPAGRAHRARSARACACACARCARARVRRTAPAFSDRVGPMVLASP